MEGGGGHGNTSRLGSFLGDACIIVAPDGYERRWYNPCHPVTFKSGVWSVTPCIVRNIYFEPSKADDVQFILDLIAKIGEKFPSADMNNVNIAGFHKFICLSICKVTVPVQAPVMEPP